MYIVGYNVHSLHFVRARWYASISSVISNVYSYADQEVYMITSENYVKLILQYYYIGVDENLKSHRKQISKENN